MAILPKRDAIVAEMLTEIDYGVGREAVLATIGKKWQIPLRTFDRYWAIARKEADAEAQRLKEARYNALHKAEMKRVTAGIMAKEERMLILSQIARAELQLPREVLSADGIQTLNVVPDYTERKAAIAELNKMDGEYAPIKKENKHSGDLTIKQDLSQFSTEELLQRAKAVKKLNG